MPTLDRSRLTELLQQEEQLFHQTHPKSYELYRRARKSLHGGVPMLWMATGTEVSAWAIMALISPAITRQDVDYHTKVIREAVQSFFG